MMDEAATRHDGESGRKNCGNV